MSVNHCEECQERLPSLLEGTLSPDEARIVSSHLDTCPDCRREQSWLATVINDLECLGDDIVRDAPEVDLVEAVLQGAAEIDLVVAAPLPNVRRLRPMRAAAMAAGWFAMAASVALVVWLAARWHESPRTPVAGNDPAKTPPARPATAAADSQAVKAQLELNRQKVAQALQNLRPASQNAAAPEAVQAPSSKDLTPEDVLRTRRAAMTSADAWAQLMQWATLTPEEARRVVDAENANDLAVIGAARSLDDAEAAETLMKVVGKYPENPYARFALAKEMGFDGVSRAGSDGDNSNSRMFWWGTGQPTGMDTGESSSAPSAKSIGGSGAGTAQYIEQLNALRTLDPENAISYLMEAEARFRAGDAAGAMALLQQAMEQPRANTYTALESQYNEQALVASGMDPETARTVTALTAGADSYSFLYSLSDVLLEYGRSYAEQSNLDSARQIFEAVQRFGEQVQESASFSQELMAGLEIQADAGGELEDVYGAMGSTEALQQLSIQMQELTDSIGQFRELSESLNSLFSMDNADWAYIIGLILTSGDLSLGDLFP